MVAAILFLAYLNRGGSPTGRIGSDRIVDPPFSRESGSEVKVVKDSPLVLTEREESKGDAEVW